MPSTRNGGREARMNDMILQASRKRPACRVLLRVCTALWLLPAVCPGALAQAEGDATAAATPQQLERRASRMVASAVEMINGGDEARGESLLDAIPRMFPGTQACFKAHLELGRRRIAKGRHDDALAQLRLVSEIMELSSRSNLDRSVIEQTFVVKWNLQLLQDKLYAAIETCQALVRLYPDTVYADLALMRIAAVRIESDNVREIESGINVYRSVLRLPNSGSKAEAQYGIALAYDKLAKLGRRWNQEAATAAAMQAFRTCAETYPDSSFAGESFKRIVEYQIGVRDYSRAVETLERVFADYPDAPWLDEMLMQWGIVLYRQGDRAGAAAKFQRVLEEYPGGQAAPTAAELLKRVR